MKLRSIKGLYKNRSQTTPSRFKQIEKQIDPDVEEAVTEAIDHAMRIHQGLIDQLKKRVSDLEERCNELSRRISASASE